MTTDSLQAKAGGPSYRDLRRAVLVFAAMFSIIIVTISVFGFLELRQNALRSAQRRADGYARILGAHLERVVSGSDAVLIQIALQSPRLGGARASDERWRPVLETARSGARSISSFSIIDANGAIRHSTQGAGNHVSPFAFISLQQQDESGLLIGTPIRTENGSYLVPLGRRLVGREGGIVAGMLDLEQLRAFYHSIDTEGGAIRALHPQGLVILQEPRGRGPTSIPDDPVIKAAATGQISGSLVGPLRTGGRSTITSYYAVPRSDLIISVSLDEETALAAWRNDAIATTLITAGMLAALVAVVVLVLRQLKERENAERRLREREHRMADAQRFESLGQLTGGVAHDFNNLLTVITNSVELLEAEPALASQRAKRAMELIEGAAERGASLTGQLLAFARRQRLQPRSFDLCKHLEGMRDFLQRGLGETISIRMELAKAPCLVSLDPSQLDSALLNLCLNARDAMPEGGEVLIEAGAVRLDESNVRNVSEEMAPGAYVELSVTDQGLGMAPEVSARAFEPFFTTKAPGLGTGLGLSMVFGFVKQSSGHIRIHSEAGVGTGVKIYFPLREAAQPDTAPSKIEPTEASGAGETVLVVEDDEKVREATVSSLERLNYRVFQCGNVAQALAILREKPVDLLFSDIVLGTSMNGADLAKAAQQVRPTLKIVLVSGYPLGAKSLESMASGIEILKKPYNAQELNRALRQALTSTASKGAVEEIEVLDTTS